MSHFPPTALVPVTLRAALCQDARRLAVVSLAAGTIGGAANRLGPSPLDWNHRSKTERLADAVPGGKSLEIGAAPRVLLADLVRGLDAGDLVLVDARPSLFYRAGHIPGALNLPRDGFTSALERHRAALGKPGEKRIVVYCQGASCEDSGLIAAALRGHGFPQPAIFSGGWKEWSAAGLEGDTGP